jgi:hypothetical protein
MTRFSKQEPEACDQGSREAAGGNDRGPSEDAGDVPPMYFGSHAIWVGSHRVPLSPTPAFAKVDAHVTEVEKVIQLWSTSRQEDKDNTAAANVTPPCPSRLEDVESIVTMPMHWHAMMSNARAVSIDPMVFEAGLSPLVTSGVTTVTSTLT